MDIQLALQRYKTLQNTAKKSDHLFKPANGNSIIRIVPYKFNKDNPFIELYFHYNINNKTYLSPMSFGRPDPIVEFAEKLKNTGDTDDWKAGRKMEPKLRTFAPVIVRGKESEGVKFWGFGKTVYQDILQYIADPDYGDITDPLSGRDIALTVTPGDDSGKTYPTTQLRIKPATSKITNDPELMKTILEDQTDITELYQELSYNELKGVLENWLSPGEASAESVDESVDTDISSFDLPKSKSKPVDSSDSGLPWDDDDAKPAASKKPAAKSSKSTNEVADAFDSLFNS